MIIISGSSNPILAAQVANITKCDFVKANIHKYDSHEIEIEISQTLSNRNVIIFQSISNPANDNLVELLMIADIAKRSNCKSIIAVIPYFGYSRQDKTEGKYGFCPLSLVAKLLQDSGISKIFTVDMHSENYKNYFKIDFHNIIPTNLFKDLFNKSDSSLIVAPDFGASKRAQFLANEIDGDVVILKKERIFDQINHQSKMVTKVNERHCIIIDDIIDTGNTLSSAINLIKENQPVSITVCATHAVFSKESINPIWYNDLKNFYITDTIYCPSLPSFIQTISVSSIIAEKILNMFSYK